MILADLAYGLNRLFTLFIHTHRLIIYLDLNCQLLLLKRLGCGFIIGRDILKHAHHEFIVSQVRVQLGNSSANQLDDFFDFNSYWFLLLAPGFAINVGQNLCQNLVEKS